MQIKTALQHIKNGKLVAINDANSDVGDWLVVASDIDYHFTSVEEVRNWLAKSNEEVFEVYGYAEVVYDGYGASFVLNGDVAKQE